MICKFMAWVLKGSKASFQSLSLDHPHIKARPLINGHSNRLKRRLHGKKEKLKDRETRTDTKTKTDRQRDTERSFLGGM